jgi:septin family protein
MRCLQDRVNIVPVIAKSDTLTPLEVRRLKTRVSEHLKISYCLVLLQYLSFETVEENS